MTKHICSNCIHAITLKVVDFQRFLDGCNLEYPKVVQSTCLDYTPKGINSAKRPINDYISRVIQNEQE